ncbi:hypothetical protein ACFL2Q_16830 [Thermodesulfobacteriota bacterium]
MPKLRRGAFSGRSQWLAVANDVRAATKQSSCFAKRLTGLSGNGRSSRRQLGRTHDVAGLIESTAALNHTG